MASIIRKHKYATTSVRLLMAFKSLLNNNLLDYKEFKATNKKNH